MLCLPQCVLGQVLVRTLGEKELPAPENIAFISKSSDGFYYLGNTTGLSVFDGKVATQITIRDQTSPFIHDQMVQSRMFEDSAGLLWFSTYTALHSYDPKQRLFQTFRIKRDGNAIQQNYHVFHLDNKADEIWLKAGNQIWSFHTINLNYRRIAGPTLGNRFRVISRQGEETHIVACPFLNGKGLEVFKLQTGRGADPRLIDLNEYVITAKETEKNTFLLGLMNGLAELHLTDSSHQFRRITSPEAALSVWDICQPPGSDLLWLSRTGLGLYAYNPLTEKFVDSITVKSGLSSPNPTEIYADGPDRLFASQYNNGIDIIEWTEKPVTSFPTLVEEKISSITLTAEAQLFAAGNRAVFQLIEASPGGKKKPFPPPETDARPPYRGKFYAANNRLFLQGLRTIWSYDWANGRWYSVPKKEYPVRGMFISSGPSFLMLAENGVQVCSIQGNQVLTETSALFSPLGTNDFLGLFQLTDSTFLLPWRSSEVWLGAYDSKGYHLRRRISIPGEIQATWHCENNGAIYAGGTSGLYLIINDQAQQIVLNNDKEPPIVESLVMDKNGILWVGTRTGLYSFNERDSTSIRYSTADGLPSNRFLDFPALALPSDSILMGTRDAFFAFDPTKLRPDSLVIRPYIFGLRINDLDVSLDSTFQLQNDQLSLPSRKNSLDFQIAIVGLHQEGASALKYQLIGYEENPVFINAHQTIRYQNLPPGNYALLLTAINRNGLPSGEKRLVITIHPPFWQTLPFYLLCTCALALLISGIYIAGLRRERLKQQRLQEQQARLAAERDRIAGEVHDDLGGQISSILYLSEEMLLTGETPAYAYELNRINELSRNSLQNVRDIIFALDNRRATLSALGEQLRGAGSDFFADRKIDFSCTDQFADPDFNLTSRQKRNLTLIIKEAWHNTAKHAAATAVTLELQQQNSVLNIVFTDNGRGFKSKKSTKVTGGYGLENMEEKAHTIGATLTIDSQPGTGTTLTLNWPLPKTDA